MMDKVHAVKVPSDLQWCSNISIIKKSLALINFFTTYKKHAYIAHIHKNFHTGDCITQRTYPIFIQYTYKHEEDVWAAIQICFNVFCNTMSHSL